MTKKPSAAKVYDFHRRLLRIQIEDHAQANGLTFPAALTDLARTRPELFTPYLKYQMNNVQ